MSEDAAKFGSDKDASLGGSSNANVEVSEARTAPQTVAEVELPVEAGGMITGDLHAWYEARKHQDEINREEPNSWLLSYPEDERWTIEHHGFNEANNPINKEYNQKLLQLCHEYNSEPLDDYPEEIQGAINAWVFTEISNLLFLNWPSYVESGVTDRLSFDEFLKAKGADRY
ncbi:hypothetical protein [Methylocystis sp. SB2]|uniref:hypothetical protein n=1 Tax=Methylocystis sp. (strain SB2) TaxID=743836 RepID=UPI001EFB40DA|nr:hypothetical protein [Methylocystis sp. SB2]ULO25094.1 hypothetical protein LNB28_06820 [Methylocystis sp. SB2]